jgi:Hemolysin coregulated protein Hcp (TssD)
MYGHGIVRTSFSSSLKTYSMAFLAKISIDGNEEINVLNCDFRFTQATDATGKPTSIPQGGFISLVVESTRETEIFDWMISPASTKHGVITFYRRDMFSKLKTLSFNDAYCVDYHESFDHKGEHPMQISFTLSAKKLTLNDSEFVNNRPLTDN